MQAIITKVIPATNTRPTRIKATCGRGSLTVAFPHELSGEACHVYVVERMCELFDEQDRKKRGSKSCHKGSWSRPKASGQIPSGEYVFCFILEPYSAGPVMLQALQNVAQTAIDYPGNAMARVNARTANDAIKAGRE